MTRTIAASTFAAAAGTLSLLGAVAADAAGASPPDAAVAVGYTHETLASFRPNSVDLGDTRKSGFDWYLFRFFGGHAKSANVVVNADGSVTLNGDVTGPNGEISTAAPAQNRAKFVGVAFGGGAYIEAAIKFDTAAASARQSPGWPSFWALSLEHAATGAEQWPGKPPGYRRFMELDIFEYDIKDGANYYGANMHDWYGVYNRTCPGHAFCDAGRDYSDVKTAVNPGTDLGRYHTYGVLWVPAKAASSGYAQFYFDRKPVGNKVTWQQMPAGAGEPKGQPWKFDVLDRQHLALILGTGVGKPMTVGSVDVWQASDSQNLRN